MAETKKRLGKGLDSLLSATRLRELDEISTVRSTSPPDTTNRTNTLDRIVEIPVDKINRNPHQPRQNWDEKKIFDLAESIKANGVIQPILIRPMGQGYQLIVGERRLRAAQLAGKETIPAIIRDASEEQTLEWALVENIHRADLNPTERARAYQHYLKTFSLTQDQAAQRLGEDRSTIANYIRLLELSGEIRQMIAESRISMGHARALLGVVDVLQRQRLAELTVRKKLSVRQLEEIVRNNRNEKEKNSDEKPRKDAHILELEQELSQTLSTRVMIKTIGRKAHRGRIIIEYYNLDDFDRIRERLR